MALNSLPVTQFCLFCYRKYSSQIADNKAESLNAFTKLLGRYLGEKTFEKSVEFKSDSILSSCVIGCCLDCSSQTEQFTNMYHQYKLLELKLQWQIIKLVNVIKLANKVPSRTSQFRKAIGKNRVTDDGKEIEVECNELKRVYTFRKAIIKNCRRKLAKSQPRVLLTSKASLVKTSKPKIVLPEENSAQALGDTTIPTTRPTKRVPEEEETSVDVGRASNGNSFIALEQNQTSFDDHDLSTNITEDVDSISTNNKPITSKTEALSCTEIDFDPLPNSDDMSITGGNIGKGNLSESVQCDVNVFIENSPPSCLEEGILEDSHLLPDCDEDQLTYDNNEEVDLMEYNDGDAGIYTNDTSKTTAQVLSLSDQAPSEDNIPIQQDMPLSPNSITIDSAFSCRQHIKRESNSNNSLIMESENEEHSNFLSDAAIISNGQASTETLNNPTQTIPNLEQNRPTVYSTVLQDQQTVCLNEESSIISVHENGDETANNIQETKVTDRKTMYETEPQQRYNLRKKQAANFAQKLEDDSSDNDNDMEFSDAEKNSSTSSSSPSSSDSESKEVTQSNSLVKRRRYNRKVKFGNRTQFLSKEVETITCPDGCAKVFQNEQMYKNHQKLHSPGQFSCNFCQVVLTNVIALATHEYTDHCPNDFTIDKQKQCPRCLLKFDFPFEYEEHFAYAHFEIGENPQNTQKITGKELQIKGLGKNPKIFRCYMDGCCKKFRNEKIYRDHSKLHLEGNYPCNFCKIVCTSIIELANHEYKKHCQKLSDYKSKEKQCSRCLLKFKYSFDYEDHFAYAHFGIGENPETKEKRRGKGQPSKDSTYHTSDVPVITCKICNRKMPKTYRASHMKQWHNARNESKRKLCKFEGCKAYFLTDQQLQSHSTSHRDEITTFSCAICNISFSVKLLLRRHMRQKHNQTVVQDVGSERQLSQLPCNFCDFKTNIPRNLAIHEEKEHSDENEDNLDNDSKKRRCPRCPYKYDLQRFYIIHHLTKHLGLLSINSPNACKLCSGTTKFVQNSKQHFRECHNINLIDEPSKILKCDVKDCPAYFLQSSQLYTHKTRMHPILDCLKCERTFQTRAYLLKHLRHCQKPYAEENHPNLSVKCDNPTCTKMFHNPAEMKMHMVHAHPKNPKVPKEKTEVCPKCEKRFISVRMLKEHLRKAHVERSLICSDCGKVFKYQHLMDSHMIFHKGPEAWEFQCTECGKKCFSKQKLEEHLRTHTKEKPFVCQFCGGKYAHRHNWRSHLKSKHVDEKGIEEIVGNGRKGNYLTRKGSKKGECVTGNSVTTAQ